MKDKPLFFICFTAILIVFIPLILIINNPDIAKNTSDIITLPLVAVFLRFTLSAIPASIVLVIYKALKLPDNCDTFYGWLYSIIFAFAIVFDIDFDFTCSIAAIATLIKIVADYSNYKK